MITQEQIQTVVRIIAKNAYPDKIILFGSYALGCPTKDSDLDLLIIKDTDLPRPKRSSAIKKHLRGLKIPIDLLVYTNEEVRQWQGVKTAFISQVLANGTVLYE